MVSQTQSDRVYLQMAIALSQLSYAKKNKVGALLVRDNSIIAEGVNGTPSGDTNECEERMEFPGGVLQTKPQVIHAELNAIFKTAGSTNNIQGSTMYISLGPCYACAVALAAVKIIRVVYREPYKTPNGIIYLQQRGIEVEQIEHPFDHTFLETELCHL